MLKYNPIICCFFLHKMGHLICVKCFFPPIVIGCYFEGSFKCQSIVFGLVGILINKCNLYFLEIADSGNLELSMPRLSHAYCRNVEDSAVRIEDIQQIVVQGLLVTIKQVET